MASGKNIVDIAADISVGVYNDGLSSIMQIMKVLSITIGSNCFNYYAEANARRITFSERLLTNTAKEAQLTLKSARKEEEEENINIESQLYSAGIAD